MNVSLTHVKVKSTWSRITGIGTCILIAFVAVTNSMFIHGLVKTNKRNLTLSHKLFIYMSAVDLLNGLVAMPILALCSVKGISCQAMSFMVAFTTFILLCSTSSLVPISVIRLRSIIDPFNARNKIKLMFLVIIQAVVSIGFAVLIYDNYLHMNLISDFVPVACSTAVFLLSLQSGVVGCNVFSLVYLRRQRNKRHQQHQISQHQPSKSCKVTNNVKIQNQVLQNCRRNTI